MGGVPTWKRRVLGIAGSWLIAGGLAHWIGAGAHELSNGTPSTAEHRIYLMMIGLVQVVAGWSHRAARRALVDGDPSWRSLEAVACALMVGWGAAESPHVWHLPLPFSVGAPTYLLVHVVMAALLLPRRSGSGALRS
jgi:hypothetical protein